MNIKGKLRDYAKTKDLSPTKLSNMIGQSDGYLRTNGAIYSDVIPVIRKVLTDLNMDWLLFDEGNMIVSNVNVLNEPTEVYENGVKEMLREELIKNIDLKKENEALRETVEQLKKDNKQVFDKP